MNLLTTRFDAHCRRNLHVTFVLLMLTAASLSITASQIALGLALLLLLMRRFLDKEPIAGTGLGLVTLALAGWALLSIPFSSDVSQSVVYYRRFYLFTALWVVATVADCDTKRLWLLLALLVGSVSISLIGLVRIHREIGMFWVSRLGDLSNPMTSGALLMLALLVTLGFLLIRPQRRGLRWILAVPAVIIALGLSQTMTRSAWLGALTGLAAMLLLVRPRVLLPLTAALIAIGLILPNLPEGVLRHRLQDRLDFAGMLQQKNVSIRLEMWQTGWQMIKARPWLGFGDHGLAQTAVEFLVHPTEDTAVYGHLHSNPITLAVIWGIPGLILATTHFVWQLILLLRWWRAARKDPARATAIQRAWMLGAIGAWVGFFVAGATEWYFGDAESMLLYLAIIGAALGARHGDHGSSSTANSRSR